MQTALTLTLLAMTVGQLGNDVNPVNQHRVLIPVDIPPASRSQISMLRLYVSTDQGKSWQLADAISPDSIPANKGFIFQAQKDGHHWFRVASVDLQGRQDPEPVWAGKADEVQKMFVDTFKPIVELSARRQGDDIVATWSVQEDYPDMRSLRLEYRAKDGPPAGWYVAPFDGNLRGQTQFRVSHAGSIIVRLSVSDLAKNTSVGTAEVNGIALAGGGEQRLPSTHSSSSYPPPQPNFPSDSGYSGLPPTTPGTPPIGSDYPPHDIPPQHPMQPLASSNNKMAVPMNAIAHDANKRVLASNTTAPAPIEGVPPPPTRQSHLPQVQYLNSTNLTFEYEISKLSPSGIGVVEVFWTLDDGQKWDLFADDPKSGPSMLPGRYKRRIELPGDGVYGFTCVAVSRAAKDMREKAGIKLGNQPKAGDAPEIRVEVDTIPPVVELFAPVPDAQRENTLLLTWTAKDRNLAAEPISLEWAENPEGPWQSCGVKQANTGRFSWTLPQRIPVQVYLRVKAADLAGNEGIAATREALYVDLGQPQARFLGVTVTQQAP